MAAFSSPQQRARDAVGSRSSPALATASNLRGIAFGKKLLVMEYTRSQEQFPLETIKDRERRRLLAEKQERWRQREEDERGLVAAEAKQQRRREELERSIRGEQARALRERRSEETVRQWRKEREELEQRERERAEEQQRAEEEQERLLTEAAERSRLRRQPERCRSCGATGRCEACGGSGARKAVFLAATIAVHPLEFGTKPRGCEMCFGCNQGIRGELQRGTGACAACAGAGKFCTGFCGPKPYSREGRGRSRCMSFFPSPPGSPGGGSPKSGAGSPKAAEELMDEVCRLCRGSIRPGLEEARQRWAAPREGR